MRVGAITLALALVGCVRSSDITQSPPAKKPPTTPTTTTTTTTTTPITTPTTPTIDGVPVPPDLAAAVVNQIAADIDDILDDTNATHGVYIVDAENGQVIYGSNEDVPYKPASNTKLFTTGAAMDLLGPDHRFEVSAFSPALPDGGGNIGDLDVVSYHDFTWSNFFYADEFFAADRLADQLYDAGVRHVNGTLTMHGEAVVDGYQFAYYDWDWHRDEALTVVEDALWLRGITVNGPLATSSGFSPVGIELASRLSPPLSTGCHPLNVYSHNEFADILLRHNGLELWAGSTYADGEAAVVDWIGGLGIDSTPLAFFDGSGLSHSNRVTARIVVEMQLAMMELPAGEAWRRTFSIGGVIGTLGGRLLGADTQGRFFGKTGTLNGVIATSGYLVNRHDGHQYVISVLMNEVDDSSAARILQNEVVEVMARDLRGAGDRPTAPVLQSVISQGDGTLSVSWDPSTNADGYTVWLTSDGVWRRTEARYTDTTAVELLTLDLNRDVDIRITADGPGGISDPSDVYSSRTAEAVADVLLVDGNDRYDTAWENTMSTGQAFAATTAHALAGRRHDTVTNEAVLSGAVSLSDYPAVIWLLGEESTTDLTFDANERDLVDDYLASGGNLLVSGAEIGWDLDYLGDVDMQGFYNASLHASYVEDDAGTFSVMPEANGIFAGIGELGFLTPPTMQVDYPDVISPQNGAVSELSYVGGFGGTAAISYSGTYKLVHMGFPFETIDNGPQRAEVMNAILGFFGI